MLLASMIFMTAAGLFVQSAFSQNPACDPALIKSGSKAEQTLWNSVKNSTSAKDFQPYLAKYPNGRCAAAAKTAIAAFNAKVAAPAGIGKFELIEETKFNENEEVTAVAFSPSGNQIVSGGWKNTLKLWNTADRTSAFAIDSMGGGDLIMGVAFSPNGKYIVTGSRDSTSKPGPSVKVWNASNGSAALALTNSPSERCETVAYSKNGERIAAGCATSDGTSTIHLWDAKTGADLNTIKGYSRPVAISSDGTRVTGYSYPTSSLKIFDASNGNEVTSIQINGLTGFLSADLSPDGKNLGTGSADGSIRIWDALTGKEVTAIKAHLGWVNSVSYSPDGLMIASGGADGSVSIWNAKTGVELWTVKGSIFVASISFSPDGTHLAVGSYGGIRLLRVVRK